MWHCIVVGIEVIGTCASFEAHATLRAARHTLLSGSGQLDSSLSLRGTQSVGLLYLNSRYLKTECSSSDTNFCCRILTISAKAPIPRDFILSELWQKPGALDGVVSFQLLPRFAILILFAFHGVVEILSENQIWEYSYFIVI